MKKLPIVFIGLLCFGSFSVYSMDSESDITIKLAFTKSERDFTGSYVKGSLDNDVNKSIEDQHRIEYLARTGGLVYEELRSGELLVSIANGGRNIKSGNLTLQARQSTIYPEALEWTGEIVINGREGVDVSRLIRSAQKVEDKLRPYINLTSFVIKPVPSYAR